MIIHKLTLQFENIFNGPTNSILQPVEKKKQFFNFRLLLTDVVLSDSIVIRLLFDSFYEFYFFFRKKQNANGMLLNYKAPDFVSFEM